MYEKILILAIAIMCVIATTQVTQLPKLNGQLSLEAPPPPAIYMNGSLVNLSADDQDRDLAIDPLDELPANGTVTMSTFGATDTDINDFPPVGVSVIIQNDTVTVTNQTVTIGGSFAAESLESSGDDSSSSSDGGDEE